MTNESLSIVTGFVLLTRLACVRYIAAVFVSYLCCASCQWKVIFEYVGLVM